MKIKGVIQKSALGLAFVSNLCFAASFSVPTPYVQRTIPNGFKLNDLSFNSRGMYDFMAWDQAGKLGDKQSLFVGGKVAVDAQAWSPENGMLDANGNPELSGSTVFLQNARLILAGKISEGASFAYGYGFRMKRNLFAFATLMPKNSNWMFSGGYMVLPFGDFNGVGAPYTFELNLTAYQVNENAVLLGYQNDNMRFAGAVFKPSSDFQQTMSDFVLDGEYDFGMADGMKLTLGGSYLYDVRGVGGGQNNLPNRGNFSQINGFMGSSFNATNSNQGKIGAYDVRAKLALNHLSILGEYVANTRNSSVTDNNKASIGSVAVSYDGIRAFNMDHRIFGGWNHTNNMSAIALTPDGFLSADTPIRNQWIAGVSTYVYTNTKASAQVVYSDTYNKKGYVSGLLDLSVYF